MINIIKKDWSNEKKKICELFFQFEGHGINLFQKTKNINEEIFKDKDIMNFYLSIKGLDNSAYFTINVKNALKHYSIDELIEFIKVNKEVYKVLPDEMKNKWELISPFFETNKNLSDHIPITLTAMILSMGKKFHDCMSGIKQCALSEKLNRNLDDKKYNLKKIKI